MQIYDDRPSLRKSPKARRFDVLMDKYMRKTVMANSQMRDVYVGVDADILNILAYRDKLQRKGSV